MRTQRWIERNIAWLFEATLEITGLAYRLQHRGAAFRIGPQIAVAQIGCREQGRPPGKIENDVTMRLRAVARSQRVARRPCRQRKPIHHDIKGTEMPLGGSDLSLGHRKFGRTGSNDGSGRRDEYRNVEMVLKKISGFNCNLVAAIDQNNSATLDGNERHIGHWYRGCRPQRHHRWSI